MIKNSIIKKVLYVVSGLILMAIMGSYFILRASLAQLDGEHGSENLKFTVNVDRDIDGLVTITGKNRNDIAYATGFVHAQERFFQMDLMRRRAAGELSQLLGSNLVKIDEKSRVHRFRDRARLFVDHLPLAEKSIIKSYTDGVNDGLNSLTLKPFEYFLLNTIPAKWEPEDSLLVSYSMYFTLQSENDINEWQSDLIERSLSPSISHLLLQKNSKWDAPLQSAKALSYEAENFPVKKNGLADKQLIHQMLNTLKQSENNHWGDIGSNNWSVSGQLTKTGSAMLANDMHLSIRVPNTWFRLRLKNSSDGLDISGLSLPGAPFIIAGSNTWVAWGFTNTAADWGDLIRVKINPDNPDQYLTPSGYQNFKHFPEKIRVKGNPPINVDIRETIWGPMVKGPSNDPMAYRWVAHFNQGANMGLYKMEQVKSVKEALSLADQMGIPAQNAMLTDRFGNIGWTIFGAIPKRKINSDEDYHAYRRPQDWSTGQYDWEGWLRSSAYPKVYNPLDYRLWTANNRVASGHDLSVVGNGRYALGARAQQIRDDLFKLKSGVTESDLLKIQMDHRAIFLKRWQQLLLQVIDHSEVKKWQILKSYLSTWDKGAAKDSVAYRLVRRFRNTVSRNLFAVITAPCKKKFKQCNLYYASRKTEIALWQLVTKQPKGILGSDYKNWQQFFEHMLKKSFSEIMTDPQTLKHYTWGEYNTLNIRHPLSQFVPLLGYLADMPHDQVSGDSYMPNVMGKNFGASERMVVSPSHEDSGILHMPTGQSGNPLSPYYAHGHNNWVKGIASPFLPGKTRWKLKMLPNNQTAP